MKIIHYIPSIGKSGGGVSSYLQLLAQDLGKIVELHIICHPNEDEHKLENCKIHYIEGHIKSLIKMKKQFCKLLDDIKPDIVHVNGCWMLQCSLTIFWAKSKGYPVILSPHGMLEPWDIKKNYWTKKLPALLLYQKRSIQICNCLIATSETEKNNLLSLGYNNNVTIVPNGIITNGIKCKQSWEEKKIILFLALYRKNKGIDLLMDSISQIKNKLKDWRIIIAGIESDYTINDLKLMAKTHGIADITEIPGPLYGKDKWNAYRDADVFILPTLNENFGIVIAESYLCGTPVITTKGTPWKSIKDNNCGWWVDRNVNSISNSILEFLATTPEQRMQMGLKGAKIVLENYSSSIVSKKMVDTYIAVINANQQLKTSSDS